MKSAEIAKIEASDLRMEDLDLETGPYCMSYGFDLEPLTNAIGETGLINPPLVRENGGGRMDVVAGYRRCLALRKLGCAEVPAKVLETDRFPPLECLLLNLYDNLPVRPFNDVEKGMLLDRLAAHLPPNRIMEKYMPLLGLPPREETFSLYRRMENEAGGKLKAALAAGTVPMSTVRVLMELASEPRSAVLCALEATGFNSNQQKQFLELLSDLAHIEGKTVYSLLAMDDLQRIVEDTRLNRPQKAKACLQVLREKRFPTLVRAERDFKSAVAGLGLPRGVKIDPPAYFEGPFYRLEICFKEGRDLLEKIGGLEKEALADFCNPWVKSK